MKFTEYREYIPMTTNITTLKTQFESFAEEQRDIGKSIANSVSMLQLDQVQEAIAGAVVEIEKVTNKTKEKSFFHKIPGLGRFISEAQESHEEQKIREGSMVEVVDRLFESLSAKRDNIVSVAHMLYDLKERLQNQVGLLEQQEVEVLAIVNEDTKDSFEAKNLLVQVQPVITKAVDRIDIIDVTIKSAQVSAEKISAMLPTLHGDLITELSIQAGLQELQDFKAIFDATVDVVEDLSATNNTTMGKVLYEVADLAVNKPTAKAIARIESTSQQKAELAAKIKAKMAEATQERENALEVLAEARVAQQHNLLGSK